MTGDPPSKSGIDQLTTADASAPLATTEAGASGTPNGVNVADGSDAAPVPAALTADTRNV